MRTLQTAALVLTLAASSSVFAAGEKTAAAPAPVAKTVAQPVTRSAVQPAAQPTAKTAAQPAAAPPAEKSLYERLGGEAAITKVVDGFVAKAAVDPKVDFFRGGRYKNMNVPVFKKHLVQLLSLAAGAKNVKYEGRDMKSAHAGMKITDAQFDALAGDLMATLQEAKVPVREAIEVMAIAGMTKKDIVGQ